MVGERDGTNRTLLYVVAAVVLVVVGVGAYLLWPRQPDHVLLVGDSVSYMAVKNIQDAFDGVDVEVITRPGFRSTDLLPLVTTAVDQRDALGKPLDRAVFLVGYNDVWRSDPATPDLPRLMKVAARYDCAVWLTLPARPGGRHPGAADFDPAKADRWNRRVEALLKNYPNLHLVKTWAKAVDDGKPGQFLTDDGVHPNPQGARLLARIMHDSLTSACRFA